MDNTLSMAGKVRTKEKCPKCGCSFRDNPLHCSVCLTTPSKYYIDIYVKQYGKLKIYSDKTGHRLDGWQRSTRVLEAIRYEIDQHIFDHTRYSAKDLRTFLFETQIEKWYEDKKSEVYKGNLAKSYVRTLKTFKDTYYLPYFKGMDLREIRTIHIHDFYKQLPRKSLKYIKNVTSALENFFNILLRHELIDKKPSFPTIALDRKPPKWIDRPTQIKVIKMLPIEHRPIFLFLAWQGVRPGEARALKVKDIDFNNGIITIARTYSDGEMKERTKSKVIIPRSMNPALKGLLKKNCNGKLPESFVFINHRTGRHYSESAMKRVWQKVRERFDIIPYQATRHSLATNLLKDGASLVAIGGILGHLNKGTTLIYTQSDIDNQKIAFNLQQKNRVAKFIRPQTGPTSKDKQ